MEHEISYVLEEIKEWEGLVTIRDKDGSEWVDYLFCPWLTRQSEWSVYNTYFNAEDVEEIRIRTDTCPLIILKQEIPAKNVRKDWLERLVIDSPVGCDGVRE